MGLTRVILVTEDLLSDAVSTQLLSHFGIDIVQNVIYEGKTYLQRKARGFNQTARAACGVFMLTDLDSPNLCPPALIAAWLHSPRNPRFLLRVAIMEVESWVMADRRAFAEFLSIPTHRIPPNTDEIPNPKEFVVSLARRSRNHRLREALVPKQMTKTVKTGSGYNNLLREFVLTQWDIERAASVSPSLNRTLARLREETEVV